MTQQPPPPPESVPHPQGYLPPMPPAYPPASGAPLPPVAGQPVISPPPPTSPDKGLQGCILWVFGGAIGCLGLLVVLLAVLIFATGQTVDGFVRGVQDLFPIGQPAQIRSISLPVIERITELSVLTTTRYNYANIVTAATEMPEFLQSLYGDRLVMVAVGHIEAGIDLSQVTQDDISLDTTTNTLTIQLPAARLQNCFLNESQSYVVERSTGIFAAPSPNFDAESRRFAVLQFRDMALETGILQEAQTKAQLVLADFLQIALNSPDSPPIRLEFAPQNPADWPTTCQ